MHWILAYATVFAKHPAKRDHSRTHQVSTRQSDDGFSRALREATAESEVTLVEPRRYLSAVTTLDYCRRGAKLASRRRAILNEF